MLYWFVCYELVLYVRVIGIDKLCYDSRLVAAARLRSCASHARAVVMCASLEYWRSSPFTPCLVMQSYYYEGKSLLTDEEFDNLKEELTWNGSKVVVMR